MQEANLQERVNQVGQAFSGVNHTREVVIQRLGGPFDYTQFQEDLRLILVEKDALDRQFRMEALPIPDPAPTRGRLPDYDFSSSIFSKDLFQPAPQKTKMTTARPAFFDQIQSEPKYSDFDYDSFKRNLAVRTQKSVL